MATSAPRIRALYRSLLRELPPRPILAKPRSPIHQRLRENISSPPTTSAATTASSSAAASPSSPQQEASAADTELLAQQTEQLLAYLRAQRTYVDLLERYNPGMGMDEEERVRLSARRVGIDLPVEYKSDEANAEAGSSGKKGQGEEN